MLALFENILYWILGYFPHHAFSYRTVLVLNDALVIQNFGNSGSAGWNA